MDQPSGKRGASFAERIAVAAVIALAVGLITGLSRASDVARAGLPTPAWVVLLEDELSVLVLIALMPAALWMVRRCPPRPLPQWRWMLPHIVATIPYSLVHVIVMGLARWIVFGLAGRPHDPWDPLRDWPYEYRKDVLTYAAVVAFATAYEAWRRPPAAAEASPSPGQEDEPLEVRDGPRRFFVRPSEIVWVEAAGNYAELHLAGRMLLQRVSLSALETRLGPAGFARIHRARLVNRAEVASVATNAAGDFTLTLRDGRTLAGSRRYRAGLTEPATA